MTPSLEGKGEFAVLGLGRSGAAVTRLLLHGGARVYVSDAARTPALEHQADGLRALGADVQLGGHDIPRVLAALCVVVSPGVPPDAPPLATARAGAVRVVSEVEVALRALGSAHPRILAVTGTNGKSTTTALVAHLLSAVGREAVAAGNIGTPLSDMALRSSPPPWIALELSSFQLHDTPSIDPAVGIITNLSPDHLDRYPSAEAYYADKARLFANAHRRSHWVLNGDDPAVLDMARPAPGARWLFSLRRPDADAAWDREHDVLMLSGAPLLPRQELPLLGDHNVANALAAALAVTVADPSHASAEARARLAEGLRTFRGLPHRLERVGEWNGVLWLNDSKATNVSSTLVALQGMSRPTVLLLGGRHKGEPYTALAPVLARVGRVVVAYGEAAPIIVRDLASTVPVERVDGPFDDVVRRARAHARAGDVILLSPACSSYDMFQNYEERGAAFRRLAQEVQ
ncbi:MAG TPA: UDP-N-acetylmuramoyl-L-alanine--D-glutamate ligase [Gemmatimonadaceae bacterium]|nr:UDP-N-acetylmuramoyl-L-alanine--D-glutamate ligase [Gemmatimonadaceae bacterium]